MSLLGKLMFWKKEDLDFEKEINKDMGMKEDDLFKDAGNQNFPGIETNDLTGKPSEEDSGMGSPMRFSQQNPLQQPTQQPPSYQRQNYGMQGMQQQQSAYQQYQVPQNVPQQMPTDRDLIMNKNMEILSSKLEAIRISLESISQRLSNIERMAYYEHEQKKW
ncbi:hypothetical protein HZB02_00190 [Candidatus Woesearchaeota archaeon]|nr:hypothetical protein [Candidatus Woesearchaeota archaeon]